MNLIQTLEREAIAALTKDKTVPEFRPGDTLRVGVKVVEGERTRVQKFEGVCIARSNKGVGSSFTVRKISASARASSASSRSIRRTSRDRGGAPRRRPPRQALLSARPHR